MSIFFDTNYITPNNPAGEDLAMALATVVNSIAISFEASSKEIVILFITVANAIAKSSPVGLLGII